MRRGDGISGFSGLAGPSVGALLIGALLWPTAGQAQSHDLDIHIVGLDSMESAALKACQRLQGYSGHVVADKLKAFREKGVLVQTIDSLMSVVQRTGQFSETMSNAFGLAMVPDSMKPVAAAAGRSCKPVPPHMVLEELIQAELDRLPRIGVGFAPLDRESAAIVGLSDTLGLLVDDVTPGMGAQKAGILAGDVIVTIAGKPMTSLAQLREVSAKWKDGEKISVEIVRNGGVRRKVSVTVKVKP